MLNAFVLRPVRTCGQCGAPFTSSRTDAYYCAPACRQKAYRQRKRLKDAMTSVSYHNAIVLAVLRAHRFRYADHCSIGPDPHCSCGMRPRNMAVWEEHIARLCK